MGLSDPWGSTKLQLSVIKKTFCSVWEQWESARNMVSNGITVLIPVYCLNYGRFASLPLEQQLRIPVYRFNDNRLTSIPLKNNSGYRKVVGMMTDLLAYRKNNHSYR